MSLVPVRATWAKSSKIATYSPPLMPYPLVGFQSVSATGGTVKPGAVLLICESLELDDAVHDVPDDPPMNSGSPDPV